MSAASTFVPLVSNMQCAAVTTCVASITEPLQSSSKASVSDWTNTAQGADCTWIGVPPTT